MLAPGVSPGIGVYRRFSPGGGDRMHRNGPSLLPPLWGWLRLISKTPGCRPGLNSYAPTVLRAATPLLNLF